MADRVLFRNGLLVRETTEKTPASLSAGHAWRHVLKWHIKFTREGHMVAHFAIAYAAPPEMLLTSFLLDPEDRWRMRHRPPRSEDVNMPKRHVAPGG